MIVCEVVLAPFLTHEDTRFAGWPDPGLLAVVGPNGAGKTALALEAVCWALWGKTARGTVPDGTVAATICAADHLPYVVSRQRSGGRASALALGGLDGNMTGQTSKETQAKIDAIFGTWEQFCATRVFSNRLAARFGSATDRERKAVVESILGLERHECAADLARAELRRRKDALEVVRRNAAAAEARLEEAKRALEAVPRPLEKVHILRMTREELEEGIKDAVAALSAADEAEKLAGRRYLVVDRARREARADAARAMEHGKDIANEVVALELRQSVLDAVQECPVCLRAVTPESRKNIVLHHAETLAPLRGKLAVARLEESRLRAEADELEADASRLAKEGEDLVKTYKGTRARLDGMRDRAAAIDRALAAEDARDAQHRGAAERVKEARAGIDAAAEAEVAAEDACLVAEAALTVLGPKGARVRLMRRALAAATDTANRILARMPIDGTGPLRVEITPSRQLADGREVDEVSVTVEGAGGGAYAGVSDGERARLDVALLLGLAGAGGARGGLLVLDELLDPLDDEGLDGVLEILREMAVDRQVVITTHNPRFLALLPASSVLRVSRSSGASVVDAGA